ncbi:alpha-D-ribose 1-methylphosphonate 5-triphosphate diphosphatase [Elioraea tepidiphila]|uniref:alpha-D-ribose 1-methylphosphonate 5-triphosphate diphosphatase n=1 Tax=Elioraea tepidiphila TaxID=457934 RepID=UPI00036AA7A1|nr:alpha-D-ribose 1-methylphosphonate 5-triphosphate diphosphatase [Elioraea tepidiphila]
MTGTLEIAGARLLLADSVSPPTTLTIRDGMIAAIGVDAPKGARELRADGLLLAPGLVDIHGDAFERQVQPRPGVDFRHDLALIDTDAQLLANGITTAFHGVTLSWEPGLRSETAFRSMVAAWQALAGRLGADHRIHLRLETYAMDQWPSAEAAIDAGAVHLLAFNDHTAEIARRAADPARASRYADRAKVTGPEVLALAKAMLARADEVEPFVATAAALARDAGLVMASHDDASPETRARWRALGCTICEFPMNEETGLAARAADEHVVMGCPNVVRGGSHLGWHSAEAMVRAGAADVLASDYFYPAMRHAAFALAARGACSLPEAWAIVSANPAAAAGLADRGRIAAGLRADLLLIDDTAPAGPEVVGTLVSGRIAWLSAAGAARLA